MKSLLSFFKRSVIKENPALVYLVGLCPLLAASETLFSGITMGVSAIIILVLSCVVISLMKNIIPKQIKLIVYMMIVAGFATVVELLLRAFIPYMYEQLGIYLPLLTVSGLIMMCVEKSADKKSVGASALDALSAGIGFFAVIFVLSFVRELFGCGTFFGLRIIPARCAALIVAMPSGGLIILGFLFAIFRKISARIEAKEEKR